MTDIAQITGLPFGMTLSQRGLLMRQARRASHLALEDAKRTDVCQNAMNAAIMLYTDCPCTSAWMSSNDDLVHICGVSQIEGIACVMGDKFPVASFEAERSDLEMPRIAAMFFHAEGTKCPRCRMVSRDVNDDGLCARCADVMELKGNPNA